MNDKQETATPATAPVEPVKKTLAERIIEQTAAKPVSDFEARPPRVSLVEFKREDLIRVLRPQSATVKRAADLLAGVMRAHPGKTVIVIREHLLIALGQLDELEEEVEELPEHGDGSQQPG